MKLLLRVLLTLVILGIAHCGQNSPGAVNASANTTTGATTETTTHRETTAIATTTQKPRPRPGFNPPVQSYAVQDKKSTDYCILFKAGVRLMFNYTTTDNKTKAVNVDLPKTKNETDWQKVSGSCGNDTQTMTITVNMFNTNWTVILIFSKSKTDIFLSSLVVKFTMTNDLFPGARHLQNYTASVENVTDLETQLKQGYRCNSNNTINFNAGLTPLVMFRTVSLNMEAFRSNNNTDLKEDYTQCEQDNDVSNLVPIIVGAALGGLVLIVLIAYLVGRKRNQRGYESV